MPPRSGKRPPQRMRDHVDQLIDGWAAERPDLDTAALAVVYRLVRIAAVWNAEIEKVFAAHGITSTDFAVLANLRRAGSPYRLNQRQLMSALRLTSGTVSLRIDKMVERGLVTRTNDPTDARASVIGLTATGRQLFDRVAPVHLANEEHLIASLPPEQRTAFADLLRTVLVDIEQPHETRPDHALGLVVGAAASAQRKRAEVGLAARHGLLVEAVHDGGAGAAAGVRPGDLLTHVDDTPLYSLACLERVLGGTARTAVLRGLRNEQPITFRVALPRR